MVMLQQITWATNERASLSAQLGPLNFTSSHAIFYINGEIADKIHLSIINRLALKIVTGVTRKKRHTLRQLI